MKLPETSWLDVFKIMTGSDYMIEGTYLLGPSFPVAGLLMCLGLATMLVIVADAIARHRDF